MKTKVIIIGLFLATFNIFSAVIHENSSNTPRQMIVGTDWWQDSDDVIAMRILCRMHKQKQINLIGVAINATMPFSVCSLDGLLRHYEVNVPIGVDLKATTYPGFNGYAAGFAKMFHSKYKSNDDAENGVALYRRLLANASEAVDIVEIGHLQILVELLDSKPDQFSELSGLELVQKKVRHLWVMGGSWPNGWEYNLSLDKQAREATAKIFKKWPTPITFLGFEVGNPVITGDKLPLSDPLQKVYNGKYHGRPSWDPMTIALAVINDLDKAGYKAVYGKASYDEQSGRNSFTSIENGTHRYVIKTKPDAWYKKLIHSYL